MRFVLYLQRYRDAFEDVGRPLPAAFWLCEFCSFKGQDLFSSWLACKKCLQVSRTSLHAMSKGQSPKPLFSHMTAQAPKRSKSSTFGEVLGNVSVLAKRRAISGFSLVSFDFFPLKNLLASTVRVRKSSALLLCSSVFSFFSNFALQSKH